MLVHDISTTSDCWEVGYVLSHRLIFFLNLTLKLTQIDFKLNSKIGIYRSKHQNKKS